MRRAVHRESNGRGSPKWLDVIANRAVEAAADGDIQAMKEIGDRLDGKAQQGVTHANDPENPLFRGVNDLSDADLAAIIATGGARAVAAQEGEGEPD